MTDAPGLKGSIEDTTQTLELSSFDGGLMSDIDLLSIPVNGSPDVQNMKFSDVSCVTSREGWVSSANIVAATANPDGCWGFVDGDGTQRMVVFANGNTYDVSGGVLVSTFTGTYTAGQRVAAYDINNVLIYSDGSTIFNSGGGSVYAPGLQNTGQRYYDPTAAVKEGPLYGPTGDATLIDPPAFKAGCAYQGCGVIGNITLTNGLQSKSDIRWSNVNLPASYIGTNADSIARGDGAGINSLEPFSLSNEQITPQSSLFIGKDGKRIYCGNGALGVLQEVQIRCPVGCLDGGTAKYIPLGDGGVVVFLGTDRQFWATDGTKATSITARRIRTELTNTINNSLALNLGQRFYAIRNFADFQYVCNVGQGKHYCLDWDHNNWTRYSGWPDGPLMEVVDGLKQPAIYAATLSGNNAVIAALNKGTTDNGNPISPYWTSASLRGYSGDDGANQGPVNKDKLWYYLTIDYTTDTAGIVLEFTPDLGQGTTETVTIPAVAGTTTNIAIFDADTYDGGKVYGTTIELQGSTKRYRKMVRIPKTGLKGTKGIMRTPDLKVKVSTLGGTGFLKINSLTFDFAPRGSQRVKNK